MCVCICRNARGTFIKSACIIYANPFTETEKRGGLACHSRDARTNPRETPSGLDGNSYNYVERERKRIVVCRVYCTRKEKKEKGKRRKREEPIWGLILIFNREMPDKGFPSYPCCWIYQFSLLYRKIVASIKNLRGPSLNVESYNNYTIRRVDR